MTWFDILVTCMSALGLILIYIIAAQDTAKMNNRFKNNLDRILDETRFTSDLNARKRFEKAVRIITADYPNFKLGAKSFEDIADAASDPRDKAYCLEWAGRCLEALDETEEGMKRYTEAIDLSPSENYCLNRLADYYSMNKRDFKKAEQYFKQSLEYDPSESATYYRLGRLYTENGASRKALEQYAVSIKVNNGYVAPMAESALEYARLGDRENCLKMYCLAIANDVQEFEKLEEAIKSCLMK